MGNTKTYYLEGELLDGVSLERFEQSAREGFHCTYCVAGIVEPRGGYLGTGEGRGPFLIAAIHSYSSCGDEGPGFVAPLFRSLLVHRLDRDWSDVWCALYEQGAEIMDWRSGAPLQWKELGPGAVVGS